MAENKVMVSARIPKELYDTCLQKYTNMSSAINAGLELLRDNECLQNENICLQNENTCKQDEEVLQEITSNLKEQIRIRDENHKEMINNLKEQLRIKDENHIEITSNLKDQVNLLVDQMRIKDSQIEKLNETLQNQVLNIHSLVQENTKLLPETTEKSKPWWKFW